MPGPIVVVEGTVLPELSLRDLFDEHRAAKAAMTVAASAEPSGDGGLRPAGIYVIERRALEHVPETGFQDVKETLIPRLYRAGDLHHLRPPGDVEPIRSRSGRAPRSLRLP